jgi:hypothetical protein
LGTRLVLIGYKNVTGDIPKYVQIIMKNGFCNVEFCFGIALSKTGRPSSTHALYSIRMRLSYPYKVGSSYPAGNFLGHTLNL